MAKPGIRADEYGDLQRLVDNVYKHAPSSYASNIDVLVRAEIDDLNQDLLEVINLIPAGTYKRATLCDQINSIVTAHGWGFTYGTVE
ncbi:hypothetical protein [Lancefieldella rimae]|uniref:hypothetical protein n=1 Tax=Lancefieldella rimae TaxID=1383 RepID=UPI003C6FACE0